MGHAFQNVLSYTRTRVTVWPLLQYRGGPITVAEYMKEVLTNPMGGFYASDGPVIGKQGHFVTSPEISNLFGDVRGFSTWDTPCHERV